MMKALTSFLAAVAVFIAIAAAALVVCDVVYFRPHRDEIAQILRKATPDERHPPADLAGLMKVSLHGNTSAAAAGLLQADLHLNMRRAAARRLVWETLVALHLSEAEKLTVILSRSFTGEGRWGASASCRALFGHELSKLTRDEAAAFVALTEHPGFIGRPTEFARRKQELISSYRPR